MARTREDLVEEIISLRKIRFDLLEENAELKTSLEHILRVTPLMGNSKNVEYIAAVCRNALGKEVK